MTSEELFALIKKNPVSVGCGVLSLALAAAIYFRSDNLPAREAELAEKSALAERYAQNIKNSAQLKEQVDDLVAANKAIEGRAIRANQLAANAQYFYRLERETGVKLVDNRQTTAATVAKPAKGTYIPVAFSVSMQGELSQLLAFLREIEAGAHYCRVLGATCTGSPANRKAPLTLSLTIEVLGLP